ncbi:MAG TPA: GFA family protein [Parvularculaceae bacterium]|nr:GFA family protein [Parvularculaceae bacterium]
MILREACCACGDIRLRCLGEPVRISVCHCLECQKRTGGAFGAQARFPRERVEFLSGDPKIFERFGDEGGKITQRFCGRCGTTVWYSIDNDPDRIAVTLGAFADPSFPPPRFSVYEERKHAWVAFNEIEPIKHDW